MKISKMFKIVAAALLLSGTAMAGPVDLSSWAAEGAGTWTTSGDNNSVTQTINTALPTVFHNQVNSQGLKLSGEITVQTTDDNDFIGFVLGYNSDYLSSPTADYILIDWKQEDQPIGGKKGLAISHVTGEISNVSAWDHTGNVEEIARATNLGDTGWVDNQTYSFDLIFTATLIEVFVNGSKELSISGAFNNGSFGFYNYSQENVLYAGIEETAVSAVPVPAALIMFAPAVLGFMGLRRKAKATIA